MPKKKVYTVTRTGPDGKRKYYRGATKREAEAKRDRDIELWERGVVVDGHVSFGEVADLWFERYVGRKNLHKRSIETIRRIMDKQILPLLGNIDILSIKPLHIDKLLEETKDMSQSTQKKVLCYTKQIFTFAIDNDIIYKSPIKQSHQITAKAPEEVKPLTEEQCQTLLNATRGTRVYPFIVLCLYCGLRKGEALGLMWKDIDFDNHDLYVNRSLVYLEGNRHGELNTELKTESAKRRIPMAPIVEEALMELKRTSRSVYVFAMKNGSYLSESSFRKMWDLIKYRQLTTATDRTLIKREINFKVHPHQLRHTCVTRWIEQGFDVTDVQRMVGHASSDITMEVYNHFREEQRYSSIRDRISCNI